MTTNITKKTDEFADYANGQRWHSNLPWHKKIIAMPVYHWALFCAAATLFLHILDIPFWLSLFGMISLIMQLPLIKQKIHTRLKSTKKLYQTIQIGGFVMGLFAIWFYFGQSFGIDVCIAFLVLCLIGKLWELYARRDGYVMLNLCLFVAASAFLWSQGLGRFIVVMCVISLVLMGFIALSDSHNTTGAGRMRALGFVVLPALPLLIVLFLFFPRLPPLWSIQMSGKQATTGVSDTMSPGDFANLSKSTELAFRVQFDKNVPNRQDLYWRGMVLTDFDGITWSTTKKQNEFWQSTSPNLPNWATILTGTPSQSYRIILEPTHQNWLFGLDYSRPQPQHRIGITDEFNLRAIYPVAEQLRYQLDYYPNASIDIALNPIDEQINRALPEGINPKSRQLAQSLYNEASGDPLAMVALIKSYIHQNNFSYTLSPKALSDARVDDFLFGSKAGFCEHYASSFVFLMRAAGVPARVVGGYQGGELGRDGTSWEVRQMDAHAWAEIWVDDRGWVRIDPTAFVAPDRIDEGMANYTDGANDLFGEGMAARLGRSQFKLLANLRRLSDQAGYYWQRDVVGYDSETQHNSLANWFNITNIKQQIWVLGGGLMAIITLIFGAMVYRRRKMYHLFDKPVALLSHRLAKQNNTLAKADSESYLAYLSRIGADDKTVQLYRQYRFGRSSQLVGSEEFKAAAIEFAKLVAVIDTNKWR